MIKVKRQGDVVLIMQESKPTEKLDVQKPVKGKTILAFGEVTGHFHGMSATLTRQYKAADGKEYLEVDAPTSLTHQEHAPIEFEPGFYEKRICREYDQELGIRRVVD